MRPEINNFLNKLPSQWNPIKQQAAKYVEDLDTLSEDGAAQVFRRPWVAPLNFGLLLFPPVEKTFLTKFEEKTGLYIPPFYQNILLEMNGCFVYGFSLYGLPKTIYTTGLLNRSTLQQFDLGTANTNWILSFKVDKKLFYIGGRSYSYDENIGYFIDKETIRSIRKNGEILKSWSSFNNFLNDEIRIAEQMMLAQKEESET